MAITIISTSMVCLLVLAFVLAASRDLSMLVRRPAKAGHGLGTGLSRIWAVGRTTLLEAWASRAWLLPVFWLIVSVVLLLVVRPYDESERIPLYMRVLLMAQEILLLVMTWVMACISLPLERERKIVITNASKPLSRLEILLGKMTGFSVMAMVLVGVMFVATWGILVFSDQRIRAAAMAEYTLAKSDYDTKVRRQEEALPPPEEKLQLAQRGSLVAANIITPPKDGFSIVGTVSTDNGVVRYLKGGSEESAVYLFSPALIGGQYADVAPTGKRPYLAFKFPLQPYPGEPLPDKIQIHVTAVRARQRLRSEQATLDLKKPDATAVWEPERVDDLYTLPGGLDLGPVEITVNCPTPGVFLEIRDGKPLDQGATADDFNILAYPDPFGSNPEIPEPHPKILGFERHDKQQIAGPGKREVEQYGPDVPLEVGIFRFPGKELSAVPVDEHGNFRLSLLVDLEKEENQSLDTMAELEIYNESASDAKSRVDLRLPMVEKRPQDIELPSRLLDAGNPGKRGDLVVLLRCETVGHWISVDNTSVRIEQPPTPFVINLLKSELVLLCEAVLLVVICVACSVRLGWPVAMLLALTFYVLGYIRAFLADLQSTGGLLSLGFPNFGHRSATYQFFDTLLESLWHFLGFIASLAPDFSRYDMLGYLTELRNMPLTSLGLDIGWTFLYTLPFIGLGYLLMRKQELG